MTEQPLESEEDAIASDLNTIQEELNENIQEIRKQLASSFSPYIFGSMIIVMIVGGLMLSLNSTIISLLALVLAGVVGLVLFIVRHFYLVRSIDSVSEYVNNGEPLKEPKDLPILNKVITFNSPRDVYDASVLMLGDGWSDLIPVFEETIESLYKEEHEEKAI